MEKTTRFVGLDVHKASIAVAVADAFGDPEDHGQIANDPSAIRKLVDRLGGADVHLSVAYEAGPTGYALHRQLSAMGIDCIVVAPSLIPTRPGDRVKTDRRDAAKLARLLRSGDLTPVWVPDEAHEALRDLVRDRDDAKQDLLRAKHRLSKFLLRHGIHPQAGVQAWGRAHEAWLNRLALDHRADQVVFDDYWSVVRDGKDRVRRLEAALVTCAAESPHGEYLAALQALRGIGFIRRSRSSPRPATCAGSRPPGHLWPTPVWSPRSTRAVPRGTAAGSPRPATGSSAMSWARRPTTPAIGRT
jgi:transposase